MTDGPIIRPLMAALLAKAETAEGVDAAPAAADAVPIEIDSFSYTSPFKAEKSSEASGSLVAGTPRIKGQPVAIKFRARIKGAGNGVTYTALVKPPHHTLLQACGRRGVFTAAVAAAVLTAGGATSATLGTGFATTAQIYRGMPLIIGAGPGNGKTPLIAEYTAGKVATLTDNFSPALDTTSSVSIPANWTYAGTSPLSIAQRATDHPSATLYYYEDGTLHKFLGCRGRVSPSANASEEGYFDFEMTGVYGGKTDASLPSGMAIPLHSGPIFLQNTNLSEAFLLGRAALPVGQFNLSDGGALESPEDANSLIGYNPAVIGQREPMLSCDPTATTVAGRDTIGDIQTGRQMTAAIRFTGQAGNRFAITFPLVQKVDAPPASKGALRSEALAIRALNPGVDSNTRDGDSVWCFF